MTGPKRRVPTWALLALLAGCCGWSYVRLAILEPRLADLLREPERHAGEVHVAGHMRVLEVEEDRFRIRLGGKPVLVHGRLDGAEVGEVVSVRARIRSDGSLEALEVQTHRGRPMKVRLSAVAAILLAGFLAWRLRWNPATRRLDVRA